MFLSSLLFIHSLKLESISPVDFIMGNQYPASFTSASTSSKLSKVRGKSHGSRIHFPRTLFCFAMFRSKRQDDVDNDIIEDFRAAEPKILHSPTPPAMTVPQIKSAICAQPYIWPHKRNFSPETTALVIIDMQKDCKCYVLP